jgi:hypothetical protein
MFSGKKALYGSQLAEQRHGTIDYGELLMKTSLNPRLLVVGAALLATSAAFAQNTTSGNTGGSTSGSGSTTMGPDTNDRATATQTEQREERPNYSWLGLLGLAGLAGLLKKPQRETVHHTETVRTPGTGSSTNPVR